MLSDVENVRKLVDLLGDRGFVDALTNAEQLVEEANQTIDRVEEIEGEANEALREANEALHEVDQRLQRFDEAISLIEAKIEAGFSVGFFYFAVTSWIGGDLLIAAGLFVMGMLGASSLLVTIVSMPQVQRLLEIGDYATDRIDRRTDAIDLDDVPETVDGVTEAVDGVTEAGSLDAGTGDRE